jgi:hypothetical protein
LENPNQCLYIKFYFFYFAAGNLRKASSKLKTYFPVPAAIKVEPNKPQKSVLTKKLKCFSKFQRLSAVIFSKIYKEDGIIYLCKDDIIIPRCRCTGERRPLD